MNSAATSVNAASERATRHVRWFAAYAWFVLAFNLAVILWGAFVRASGSGAGCGNHWPLCNGEVLPQFARVATMIEFAHRFTSAILVALVLGLVAGAWKLFPSRHAVRKASLWAALLTLTEGLFGAALVLLGHVAENTSPWRGLSLSLHLMNTLALIASLAAAAWFSSSFVEVRPQTLPRAAHLLRLGFISCAALALTYAAGGIAALADTLFPVASLQEGFRQDLASGSHLFVHLRVIHPVIAVIAAACIFLFFTSLNGEPLSSRIKRLQMWLLAVLVAQLIAGVANLLLLHPVWLQLLHLLIADLLWICLFLLTVELRRSTS